MYSGPIAGAGYAHARRGARHGPSGSCSSGPRTACGSTASRRRGADVVAHPARRRPDRRRRAARRARRCPVVASTTTAHAPEHSLEVHLPFLQRTLGEFTVAAARRRPRRARRPSPRSSTPCGAGPRRSSSSAATSATTSTTTRRRRATGARPTRSSPARSTGLDPYDACGAYPVRGLLRERRPPRARASTSLDLRNSGDTAGPRDRVVGYGAFALRAAGRGRRQRTRRPARRARATGSGPRCSRSPNGPSPGSLTSRRAPGAELADEPTPTSVLTAHGARRFVTLSATGGSSAASGSLEPGDPLVVDVARGADRGRVRRPAPPAVTTDDFRAMSVKVSVLSAARAAARGGSFDDLIEPCARPSTASSSRPAATGRPCCPRCGTSSRTARTSSTRSGRRPGSPTDLARGDPRPSLHDRRVRRPRPAGALNRRGSPNDAGRAHTSSVSATRGPRLTRGRDHGTKPWIERLRGIDLFAQCTDKELEQIDALMTEVRLPEGKRPDARGRRRSRGFVIESGEAVVTRDGAEVARRGPGTIVGEMALLDQGPRSATVTAATPHRGLRVQPR